jgi:hypothetical protein
MLDATCELLADAPAPLRTRQRVRFHVGTSEVMGRVHPVVATTIEPGQAGYVQLRLEAPVIALPRDRYVIRSYSPMVTIGGGELLDVAPAKARRSAGLVERLRTLEAGAPAAVLEAHIQRVGGGGARTSELRARTPFGPEALRGFLQDLVARERVLVVDREWYVHTEAAERLAREAAAALAAFHAREPLKPDVEGKAAHAPGASRSGLPRTARPFRRGRILVVDEDKVRAAHAVRPTPAQAASDLLEADPRRVAPPPGGGVREAGARGPPPRPSPSFGRRSPPGADPRALPHRAPDGGERVRAFLEERREITPQEGPPRDLRSTRFPCWSGKRPAPDRSGRRWRVLRDGATTG